MTRERLPFGVRTPNRRYTGRSPVALVMPASTAGRALGIREVSIHAIDDNGHRTLVANTQGLNAEAAADAAFLRHVRNVRQAFEWWVAFQVVLEDGTLRDFEHRVGQYHTNGTVRQAAILHAAWRFMDTKLAEATRTSHLRSAERLAGKPVRILQPSLREVQAHEQRYETPASGLRIASKLHADHLVIVVDLNAPLLSRDASFPVCRETSAGPVSHQEFASAAPIIVSPGVGP